MSSRVSCLSDDSSMCTLPALAASSGMPSIVPNGRIGKSRGHFSLLFLEVCSLTFSSCSYLYCYNKEEKCVFNFVEILSHFFSLK